MNTQSGIFYGNYHAEFSKDVFPTFSQRCFMFAGQGDFSFQELMRISGLSRFVQRRLKEIDQILEENGLPPIVEGHRESFVHRNLASYAFQVGLFEELISRNIRPRMITGHSFGEFPAIVASGIMPFAEMARIILERELCAPHLKSLGAMVAVKNSDLLKDITKEVEGVFVANLNSPEQIVYSCSAESLASFKEALSKNRISHVELGVPHPYHSPLMKPLTEQFVSRTDFSKLGLKPPLIPLMSSVIHQIVDAQNFSRDTVVKMIRNQLLEPVDFERQIREIYATGTRNFIEIGFSNNLSGFVSKTLRDSAHKVSSGLGCLPRQKQSVEEVEEVKNKKVIGILNKVLKFVTGYELVSIKVQDRMQEDLGIDSIKKAEIVFRVLDEIGANRLIADQSVNLSNLATINDVLSYFDRQDRLLTSIPETEEIDYGDDYFTFKAKIPEWKSYELSHLDHAIFRPVKSLTTTYVRKGEAPPPREIERFLCTSSSQARIVNFILEPPFNLDASTHATFNEEFISWYSDFFNYFKEINLLPPWNESNCHFHLVYRKKHDVLAQTVITFLKSWSCEQGTLGFRAIEVEDDFDFKKDEEILNRQSSDLHYMKIRLTKNGRFVPHYSEVSLPALEETKLGYENIIVLAGHRGVGWEIVQRLASKTRGKILIVGRTASDSSELVNRFSSLKEKIAYRSGDLTDPEFYDTAVSDFAQAFGRIDLLVNCVGYATNTTVKETSQKEYYLECETKIRIALSTLRIKEKFKIPSCLFISSIVAHYGNAGQATYCMANAFLDQLARLHPFVKVIAWGPWKGIGLSESVQVERFINLSGIHYIEPKMATDFIERILHAPSAGASICVYNYASEIRYEGFWTDRKSYRQFYTINQAPSVSRQMELLGYNLKDLPYLRDHMLSGQPIVAASNMIALFLCLGQIIFKERPVVEDFEGNNFMFVQEEKSLFTLDAKRYNYVHPKRIDVSIASSVKHSQAVINRSERKKAPMKVPVPKYSHVIREDETKNPVIQVKGSFEFPCTLLCDPNTKDVVIEFSRSAFPVATEIPLYDYTYQIIELCHQTLGATAHWRTDRISVPRGLGRFEWHEHTKWTDTLYAVQKITHVDEKFIIGDAWIVNSDEEVIAVVKDMKFGFIREYPSKIKISPRHERV
jgi:malonyl CoA-acyl carrier protein transacylase